MTLDDAIAHAEQMAELAKWGPLEDECKQYVEWFKELKVLRSENASLRYLVTDYDSVLSTIMSECRYDDDLLAFVDDMVLKALRMRADLLGIEVDE